MNFPDKTLINVFKISAQGRDLALIIGDGTNIKIPSEIKPPLGSESWECPANLLSPEGSGGLWVLGGLGGPGGPEVCEVREGRRSESSGRSGRSRKSGGSERYM